MWQRGDRVRHHEHGDGLVAARLVLGRVVVAFDAAPRLPRTVLVEELEVAVGERAPSTARAGGTLGRANASQVRATAQARAESRHSRPRDPALSAAPAQGAPISAELASGRLRPAASARRAKRAASPSVLAAAPAISAPADSALATSEAARLAPLAPLDPVDAWQTLEALRLGVVPARGIREYTVSRDAELASIDALLAEGRGCRVVWGDYGAGKTHLLEAAEQLALERGFAVARVTLDPSEHGLQNPLRLYRAIAEGVRTLEHAQPGIEHVLDRLVDSEEHARPDGAAASRFFSPYLFSARIGEPTWTRVMGDYVRGQPIPIDVANQCLAKLEWRGERLLAMSDFRTYGRMYAHLVGTLAAWCKDAGLAGLALCFDEVERVDALAAEDRRFALAVLRHYAALTMRPEDLCFDPEELYRGGHDVHRALPLRFRSELPLVGLFALTPLSDIVERFRDVTRSTRYDLHLGPLGRRDLFALVERIAALYRRAFPAAEIDAETVARVRELAERAHGMGEDSFRAVVRATVLALDAARAGRLPRAAARAIAR